ncbi:MAG TPA: DUF402 domain-containing protein [Acidimicrobiales bacterium]|nr:DUF402 domain-containing protein [Acidimicrobiales bacterium]
MSDRWRYGDVIVRREVLGLAPVRQVDSNPTWHGRPWLAIPVIVVEDTDDALVTYMPSGAEFGFFEGGWPTADGRHPWSPRARWSGHGCLMVQRPGDHYAVWHFWSGPNRDFLHWYINLQTAFVRTEHGYDTQDLELDIVVSPDEHWVLKDDDVLVDRVREGRFSESFVEWIESIGATLTSDLRAGRQLWDRDWTTWKPPADWANTPLPRHWHDV